MPPYDLARHQMGSCNGFLSDRLPGLYPGLSEKVNIGGISVSKIRPESFKLKNHPIVVMLLYRSFLTGPLHRFILSLNRFGLKPVWQGTSQSPKNTREILMPAFVKWFFKFPASRLSRRIGLWVFISVIVIETIIFIPSYMNRKRELLAQIKDMSSVEVELIMKITPRQVPDEELLHQLEELIRHHTIVGGSLYRPDGQIAGSFGETPELQLSQVQSDNITARLNQDGSRYDVVQRAPRPSGNYYLIVRNDASRVKTDLFHFFLRISGLVIIISLFVAAGA